MENIQTTQDYCDTNRVEAKTAAIRMRGVSITIEASKKCEQFKRTPEMSIEQIRKIFNNLKRE